MSNCKNCNKELIQTEGKRPKEYCDATCRSAYFRTHKKKEPKYVQYKTFQALKEKFDAAVASSTLVDEKNVEEIKKNVAENNLPENKERILKERHTPHNLGEKHKKSQPLPISTVTLDKNRQTKEPEKGTNAYFLKYGTFE